MALLVGVIITGCLVACVPPTTSDDATVVTISILGLEGQVVLSPTEVETVSGENILTVLKKAADDANIDVQTAQFAGVGEYVTGIGSLSAGEYGEMSGWIYKVDGESPNVGMSGYKLVGGENIEVEYATSF